MNKIFNKRSGISIPRKLGKQMDTDEQSYWNKSNKISNLVRYSKLIEFLRSKGEKSVKSQNKKVKNDDK